MLLSQKDSTFTQGHMDDLLCLKSIRYLWRQKHPSVKKSMRLKLEDDIKIQQRPDLRGANLSCIELRRPGSRSLINSNNSTFIHCLSYTGYRGLNEDQAERYISIDAERRDEHEIFTV